MAYNNLDWIVAWYVDDYVTLTDTQEKEFDAVIKSFVSWHRKSELPHYIFQIQQIKIDVNNGIKQSNIKNYTDSLRHFLEVVLTEAEPEITRLAYSLTEQQVEAFLEAVEQRNLDSIAKNQAASADERLQKKLKRIESRITSFTGALSAEQKQLLKETNQALLPTFEHWIEFRRTWASSIRNAYVVRNNIIALEGKGETAKIAFRRALKPAILETDELRSDAYLTIRKHNQAIWTVSLEKLMLSLNKKQLNALNNKLNDMIGDLEALI
jgi:hypothetical protein